MEVNGKELFETIKYNRPALDEQKHSIMLMETLGSDVKNTIPRFCLRARISERTFYKWVEKSELFRECYGLAMVLAKVNWDELGVQIFNEIPIPGTSNHKFEYWRMLGWSRFGIGKNSRIRLNLDPNVSPDKHYGQLIEQATNGDFTAGEIKQLMEAINVGLNTQQVVGLQKEIDALKSDLVTMVENTNAHNHFADKGITKKD